MSVMRPSAATDMCRPHLTSSFFSIGSNSRFAPREKPDVAPLCRISAHARSYATALAPALVAAAAVAAIVLLLADNKSAPASRHSLTVAFAAKFDRQPVLSTPGGNLVAANLTDDLALGMPRREPRLTASAIFPTQLVQGFGAAIPPRALCRDAHWQGKDLSQMWFARADCSGAQLQGAKLVGTNFRGANLANAQLQEATAWYANFDRAYLGKANLANADLARASFRQTTLMSANLQHAILKATNMTQANLLGAVLLGANLTNANLQGAILTGARFDGVDLTGANLKGADLSRADLSKARGLTAAQLKLANTDSGTLVPKSMEPAAAPSQ